MSGGVTKRTQKKQVEESVRRFTRNPEDSNLMALLVIPAFEQMIKSGTLSKPEVLRVVNLAEMALTAIREGKIETTE